MKFLISLLFTLTVFLAHAQVSSNDKDSVNVALTITNTGIHGKSNGLIDTTNVALGTKANGSIIDNFPRPYNTMLGIKAMSVNEKGVENLAMGNNALMANRSRNYVTAIGAESHYLVSSGDFSTGIGYATLSKSSALNNSAFGFNTLINNTSGKDNTAMGADALYSGTNPFIHSNTAVGSKALNAATSGRENAVVGYATASTGTTPTFGAALGSEAMKKNSSSSSCVAIGALALDSILVVTGTTVVGAGAMHNHRSGYFNVAAGYEALNGSTKGTNNVALGAMSQWLDLEGEDNVSVGSESLRSITSSRGNVGIGFQTLYSHIGAGFTGFNTAIGYKALYSNTTVAASLAIGAEALYSNTTGAFNMAVGNLTLHNNTTGARNVAVGYKALMNNTTGASNTAAGIEALFNNSTGANNIAIGIAALYNNLTGGNQTVLGDSAMYNYNGTGTYNAAIGKKAGFSLVSGSYNLFAGSFSDATGNFNNASAIGARAIVNASNKVRIGDASVTVIEGQVPFSNVSDKRLKENIEYSSRLGVDFIMGLQSASYQYKSDKTHTRHDGFIAQDIEKLMEDLNIPFSGLKKADDGTYSLAYSDFIMPLVNARKAQIEKMAQLQKEMKEVQKEYAFLLEKLGAKEELKAAINELQMSDK